MIQEIQLAISKMIKDTAIRPNTIRIHPADTAKLKSYASYSYGLQDGRIFKTILGLRVIETTKVKEAEAEVYHDKMFYEVKRDLK